LGTPLEFFCPLSETCFPTAKLFSWWVFTRLLDVIGAAMDPNIETSIDRVAPSIACTPAAEYVRMSTDHQQYSTANQSQAIREYAERHGFRIEKTYVDSGKSGLNLDHRDALKQLIEDVQNGAATYLTILVYDVSRWGRFQDADEKRLL
jgi:Resolvase, N terminal domain